MYCIGLDIGGTKCAVSLGRLGEKIEIAERYEVPTLSSPEATLEKLSGETEKFLKKAEIEAIGISCGGPLDAKRA